GDRDAPLARDVVDPQRVTARADFVEHRRVSRSPFYLPLDHILVAALAIVPGGADLHLDADHIGVGVDDQRPDVPPDVQPDMLGTGAGPVVLRVPPAVLAVPVTVAVHLSSRTLLFRLAGELESPVWGRDVGKRRLGATRKGGDPLFDGADRRVGNIAFVH